MSMQPTPEQREQAMAAAEETGTDPAVVAAGASVVLSWYYFFVRGDRQRGVFVGLWAPTLLSFASYFRQTRMHDRLERASNPSGVRETVQRMVGGQ